MDIVDNAQIDQREHITFCKKLEIWNPKEYFRNTLKTWGAFTSIISGSSKSGKSNLLKNLLVGETNLLKQFDFVIIFSKTLVNGFYQSFIDSQLMFKEFQPAIINDFMRLSEQQKVKGKKFRWLVILDDIVSNKSKYVEEITDLFYTGRHYGASIIFLTQKASLMQTGWVANCMVFVSLFAGSRNEKQYISNKVIADVIDNEFSHKKLTDVERIAYSIQTNICQDFQALVILPYEKEKIFKYKADLMKTRQKQAESIYVKFMKKDALKELKKED